MSQAPIGPAPATPPAWPAQGHSTPRTPSRLVAALTAVLALLALAVAVAAWFRAEPKPAAAPVYSEQQVADAKKAVCDAFARAQHMLEVNKDHSGNTETEVLVAGVNTRFAVFVAGSYVTRAVQSNPAAPVELIGEAQRLADAFESISIDQLAVTDQSLLDIDYKAAENSAANLSELCR